MANFISCYIYLTTQDFPDFDLAINSILKGSKPNGFIESHVILLKKIQ
jgi:hypothetical protein